MISISYYGNSMPPSGDEPMSHQPVWSKEWDKSPFGKGAIMDWKTGTVRTPLFEEEEEPKKKEPFIWPYWNVTAEMQENGEVELVVATGKVAWVKSWRPPSPANAIDTSSLLPEIEEKFCYETRIPDIEKSGTVFWHGLHENSEGFIVFVPTGETPPKDYDKRIGFWIALAEITIEEGGEESEDDSSKSPVDVDSVVEWEGYTEYPQYGLRIKQLHGKVIYLSLWQAQSAPAIIRANDGVEVHADIYENGLSQQLTSVGELYVPELVAYSLSYTALPVGAVVLAHRFHAIETGGSDE